MIIAKSKSDQNKALIDPWTAVHLAAGLAAGLMNVKLGTAMVAATAYEVLEQEVEKSAAGQEIFATSGPERIGNVVVDLATFWIGHALGRRWNATGSSVGDEGQGDDDDGE